MFRSFLSRLWAWPFQPTPPPVALPRPFPDGSITYNCEEVLHIVAHHAAQRYGPDGPWSADVTARSSGITGLIEIRVEFKPFAPPASR